MLCAMKNSHSLRGIAGLALSAVALAVVAPPTSVQAASGGDYFIVFSNERSGDLTLINGGDFSVAATIPVGKRPRGLHQAHCGSPCGMASPVCSG